MLDDFIIVDFITFVMKGRDGKLNNLIVKELSIGRLVEYPISTYTFKPPTVNLDAKETIQTNFIEDLTGLKYYSGDLPYTLLGFILSINIHKTDKIIVKGHQKREFLEKYFDFVFNVEDFASHCPSFKKLTSNKQLGLTHSNHKLCSEGHVITLRNWILENVHYFTIRDIERQHESYINSEMCM